MIDEIGNRYGKLTVIERSSLKFGNSTAAMWQCRCDCGKLSVVSGNLLRGRKVLSCGCSKLRDKSGNRYGKLLVITRDESNSHNWICKCDCGNTASVGGNLLQNRGGKHSCGCLEAIIEPEIGKKYNKLTVQKKVPETINIFTCVCDCGNEITAKGYEIVMGYKKGCRRGCASKKSFGESHFNYIYNTYKKSSRNRKIKFNLSKDEFRIITSKNCFYCGVEPKPGGDNPKHFNGMYKHNGIDRVNNDKEYSFSNVVPCCWICNRAKQVVPQRDFKNWIISVYDYWASHIS